MKFLSFYGLYCANIVCLCIVNGSTPIKNITKTDGCLRAARAGYSESPNAAAVTGFHRKANDDRRKFKSETNQSRRERREGEYLAGESS